MVSCKYCGHAGLTWHQTSGGKWRLMEPESGNLHSCLIDNHLNREELIKFLVGIGFDVYVPSSRKWLHVLTFSNDTQSLYILIARYGIHLMLFDGILNENLNPLGKFEVPNGAIIQNFYHLSPVSVHEHIKSLCIRFSVNIPLTNDQMSDHGRNRTMSEHKEFLSGYQASREDSDYSVQDVVDAFSNGDGGPTYIGDDIWM